MADIFFLQEKIIPFSKIPRAKLEDESKTGTKRKKRVPAFGKDELLALMRDCDGDCKKIAKALGISKQSAEGLLRTYELID